MAVIYLVRHGQASFGTDDYDRLSELGRRQARHVGQALGSLGVRADLVVSGSLRRQAETARELVAGAGWANGTLADPRWDEFDHQSLAAAAGELDADARTDSRLFQEALEAGMRTWAGQGPRAVLGETFAAFQDRSWTALRELAEGLPARGTAVVSTSGGVIGWLAAALLAGGVDQWISLNRVCANGAYTKILKGRSGLSLISFNEHAHLPAEELTYR